MPGEGYSQSGYGPPIVTLAAHADASVVVTGTSAYVVQVGVLATDAQHGVRGGGTQHAVVVASGAAGFMSGADKAKLDALPATVADVAAQYLTLAANATLTNERVFTPSSGLTAVDAGAGAAYTLTADLVTGKNQANSTVVGGTLTAQTLTLQANLVDVFPVILSGTQLKVGTAEATSLVFHLGTFNAGVTTIISRNTTNDVETALQASTATGVVGTATNHPFEIKSNNTVAVTIGTSQDVGIGVAASTSYKLLVQKTGAATANFSRFQGAGGGGGYTLEVGCSSSSEAAAIAGHANDAASTLMGIARANLAAFYGRSGSVVTALGSENASGDVQIAPGNSTKVWMLSTGFVGIGASPIASTKFYIEDAGTANNCAIFKSTSSSGSVVVGLRQQGNFNLYITSNGSAAAGGSLGGSTDANYGCIYPPASNLSGIKLGTAGTADLQLITSNVLRFTITSAGVLQLGAASLVANGSVATTMTSLGPVGSHTTIQEWALVKGTGGVDRWSPLY